MKLNLSGAKVSGFAYEWLRAQSQATGGAPGRMPRLSRRRSATAKSSASFVVIMGRARSPLRSWRGPGDSLLEAVEV
jgi:hypothetical protein